MLATTLSVVGVSQEQPRGLAAVPEDSHIQCGTTVNEGLHGRALQPQQVADGEPLSFDQDPILLFPSYSGTLTLRNLSVVGDLPTLEFQRVNPDGPSISEMWTRVGTRAISGRLISVFEPSWNAAVINGLFRYRIGYDNPSLTLGSIAVGAGTRNISIRVGFGGIAHSDVTVIDSNAQYASNILNLVIPNFGDERVSEGSYGFDLYAATKQALHYLSDTYDDIAFIPVSTPIADYGAFHQNAQNTVTGINIAPFDSTSLYGSNHRLQRVELDAGAAGARYEDTNHEMAHQWNSDFDWGRIAGIARAGHHPQSHSPLWSGGESMMSAVLWPNRRVGQNGSAFAIELTAAPVRFHPVELYGMGVATADEIQDFQVFDQQGQFDPANAVIPAIGAVVIGGAKTVGIRDVIREHGTRTGSRPAVWRRATVLVSSGRLASQTEMDHWNFFAQRLSDRTDAATPTYDGYVPFRAATHNAIRLITSIEVPGRPTLAEVLDTASPRFGSGDWRDVSFTQPVPSRLAVSDVLRLAGHVTARDRNDFYSIGLVFFANSGSVSIPFYGSVSRSGDFTVDVRFSEAQRGRYQVGATLFWPNSGPQHARTYLSTFIVD